MREVFACKDKGWQWSSVEEFKFQGKKNETKHENGRTGSWEIEKKFWKMETSGIPSLSKQEYHQTCA